MARPLVPRFCRRGSVSLRTKARDVIYRVAREGLEANAPALMRSRDVELALQTLLSHQPVGELNDLVGYVTLLRQCIEPMKCDCRMVKPPDDGAAAAVGQFEALCASLQEALPPTPVATALRIAKIADEYRGGRHRKAHGRHRGLVSHHFVVSSSDGRKGRLLSAVVQSLQPKRILELGTGYGISGLFMGLALSELGADGEDFSIQTIESAEPQATLARELLMREIGERVRCSTGRTREALPELARVARAFDFVFHDAGHTYEDYCGDFELMEPHLRSGAVLLLDDIRWDDSRYTSQPARSYEGWQAVMQHPRIACAAEIDGTMGLALMA